MGDRVPSDHDTVQSHRVAVESVGRTDRLRIALPDSLDLEPGAVVRLSLGGEDYHAQVEETLDGSLALSGAYANARLARDPDGSENHLASWLADTGRTAGQSVLLDVLVPGGHYGLREPGSRVVYTVREPPSESLSDIADSLGE